MSNPPSIAAADWNLVHQAALEAANASDDQSLDRARRTMCILLKNLRTKYGEHPLLLATEADYVETPEESIGLLLQAYESAMSYCDLEQRVDIALSIALEYAENIGDVGKARQWVATARAAAGGSLSSHDFEINMIRLALRQAERRED